MPNTEGELIGGVVMALTELVGSDKYFLRKGKDREGKCPYCKSKTWEWVDGRWQLDHKKDCTVALSRSLLRTLIGENDDVEPPGGLGEHET